MILRNDGWYKADKGKRFVLTQKGKDNCASFKNKTVGEPVSEYEYEAVHWSVEKGYEIEEDIPDWIVKEGFEVVYDHNGYTLHAGNPIVFPEKELAENYLIRYSAYPWVEEKLYLRTAVYEGKALKECRMHQGKKVYNKSWYFGIAALRVGDLVEEDIVEKLVYCMPPACNRKDCSQLGEPTSTRVDENGKYRQTYETFKKITENIWEYCGDCFAGENVVRGKEMPLA